MLSAMLQTMRPKQWVKNGFLFIAFIFDRQLTNFPALVQILAGFAVFSLLASSIYIINDLTDLQADRQHPKKSSRPLASGRLSPGFAHAAVFVFLAISLPAAYALSPGFLTLCILYIITNLAYTYWLKHVPLVDVLLLAGFYVIRVGAGVTLIEVERFSPWLYVFTTFLALFLGIGKRRAELSLMASDASATRRVLDGYTLPFLDQMTIVVSAMTIMTYSLYSFSAPNLPENHAMMLTIPFVIYGIFRYLYLVQVKHSGEAPTEVLYTDRPLQICVVLFGLAILIIFYFF